MLYGSIVMLPFVRLLVLLLLLFGRYMSFRWRTLLPPAAVTGRICTMNDVNGIFPRPRLESERPPLLSSGPK
jgi:hypothetical protein